MPNWFMTTLKRTVIKHYFIHGCPMKPFFIEIQNFGLGQTNLEDKFWDIQGIFGQTISTHFGTISTKN